MFRLGSLGLGLGLWLGLVGALGWGLAYGKVLV